MNIAVFTPGFPADQDDTTCVPYVQDWLIAHRCLYPKDRLTVYSLQYPHLPSRYQWQGMRILALGGADRSGLSRLATWKRAVAAFHRDHRNEPYDLLHALWLDESSVLACLLGLMYEIRTVVSTMGRDCLQMRPRYRWVLGRNVAVVSCTEFVRQKVLSHHRTESERVIPWGIHDYRSSSAESRFIDLLGVGSLSGVKRFETFVHIVWLLVHRGFRIRAVLVGDGEEREAIRHRINVLGLTEVIEMAGHIDRLLVRDMMTKSKVLLHPAEFEGQGLVFLEALQAGMYVICREVSDSFDPKMIRCSSTQEMLEQTVRILQTATDFQSVRVPTGEDTARAYRQLYVS